MKHTELRQSIRARVAQRVGLKPEEISLTTPLEQYGLDSLEAANLTGELEAALHIRIEPTALWDYRTVWELSVFLADQIGAEIEMPEDEGELQAILELMESKERVE